jgi:hypothetical protein
MNHAMLIPCFTVPREHTNPKKKITDLTLTRRREHGMQDSSQKHGEQSAVHSMLKISLETASMRKQSCRRMKKKIKDS